MGATAGAMLITSQLFAMKSYLLQKGLPGNLPKNNPGNIRLTSDRWLGQVPLEETTERTWVEFKALSYGIRAMIMVIANIVIRRNVKTLYDMISIYAPKADSNNPDRYYAFLASRGSKTLPVDKQSWIKLIQSMIIFETGYLAEKLVEHSDISQGYELVRWRILTDYYDKIKKV